MSKELTPEEVSAYIRNWDTFANVSRAPSLPTSFPKVEASAAPSETVSARRCLTIRKLGVALGDAVKCHCGTLLKYASTSSYEPGKDQPAIGYARFAHCRPCNTIIIGALASTKDEHAALNSDRANRIADKAQILEDKLRAEMGRAAFEAWQAANLVELK